VPPLADSSISKAHFMCHESCGLCRPRSDLSCHHSASCLSNLWDVRAFCGLSSTFCTAVVAMQWRWLSLARRSPVRKEGR
jgi:hypothetical protein